MSVFLCIILRHKIIIIIIKQHLVHGDQAEADDGLRHAHQQEQLLLQRTGVDSEKFVNAKKCKRFLERDYYIIKDVLG